MKENNWQAILAVPFMSKLFVFFQQMYIHHAIYDLVFKYVGTIEASEVSLFDFWRLITLIQCI